MGFGNYGICDLWDFGIMGEGGRRGAKQREKGRARALVHQFCHCKCLSDILRSDSAPGTAALRNWVAVVGEVMKERRRRERERLII